MARFAIVEDKVLVVGIGGAGIAALNRMVATGLRGAEFLAIDTSKRSLVEAHVRDRLHIGESVTAGLGTRGNPKLGQEAAQADRERIAEAFPRQDIVLAVAGLGGGTGSGAGPVVARAARKAGAFYLGIVTRPFAAEGIGRMRVAREAVDEWEAWADAVVVIPAQRLLTTGSESVPLRAAFELADETLARAVEGITAPTLRSAGVRLGFGAIRAVLQNGGHTIFGVGEASGEGRALTAARKAIRSPLLEGIPLEGARRLLVSISSGYDARILEVNNAVSSIGDEAGSTARITWCTVLDRNLGSRFRVLVYRPDCPVDPGH